MQIFTAALMIALSVVVVVTRRPGKDTSILWASVLISISLLFNVDCVYVVVDQLLYGRNYADLGANLLLLVGVYFLARAIHRAARPLPVLGHSKSPRVLGKFGVMVAASAAAAFFSLIDAPITSTAFMMQYGAQPAAALYSAVQYVYIGAVMAAAGWTCLRFRKSWSTGNYKTAFALVGMGCLSAVLLVVNVLALDTLHVLGELQAMATLSGLYGVLNATTFTLLCTGLALPPARRKILSIYEASRINSMLAELDPVWKVAIAGNAGVTLDFAVVPERPHRRRRELHRMIVEIQDSLVRDPGSRKRIGSDGLDKLARATRYLERQSWRSR